jgi:hypothetical protein
MNAKRIIATIPHSDGRALQSGKLKFPGSGITKAIA